MVVRADKAENRYRIVQWLLNLGNVLERIQKAESVQRRKKNRLKVSYIVQLLVAQDVGHRGEDKRMVRFDCP